MGPFLFDYNCACRVKDSKDSKDINDINDIKDCEVRQSILKKTGVLNSA